MLLIGEFARAGNGYRWYSPAQFAQLNQIQAFKDMGFALQEIRERLRRRLVPQELRAVLEERREVLRKRVRDDVGRLERIEARLNSISAGGPHSHLTIMLRTAPGQSVASLREKLQNYDQVDELFTTLERRVPPRVLYDQRELSFTVALKAMARSIAKSFDFSNIPKYARETVLPIGMLNRLSLFRAGCRPSM